MIPAAGEGYVYATTGADYTALARRSARTLRQVSPGARIDLFTDQPIEDPVFERIHRLRSAGRFPKVEALGRSRFARSILLDADIVPLTDVSELFSLTRRYPLSAMIGWARPALLWRGQGDIPRCFPYFNSGVLVARRGRRVRQLSRAWAAEMASGVHKYDQVPLRRLCWDLGIRVGSVPHEYNMISAPMLGIWEKHMGAPRMLHWRKLHFAPPGDPEQPLRLADLVPQEQVALIEALFAAEARQRSAPPTLPPWRRSGLGIAAIRLWKRLTL